MVTVTQIKNELADREAIRDCLARYCRGVDRLDADVLRTVYWPDATDHHSGFTGNPEEFIAWAFPKLGSFHTNIHLIGNPLIRLDGAKATVETYYWSISTLPEGSPVRDAITVGRYFDKFEKRNDEWRILDRTVIHDWFQESATTCNWDIGLFGLKDVERGHHGNKKDATYKGLPVV